VAGDSDWSAGCENSGSESNDAVDSLTDVLRLPGLACECISANDGGPLDSHDDTLTMLNGHKRAAPRA